LAFNQWHDLAYTLKEEAMLQHGLQTPAMGASHSFTEIFENIRRLNSKKAMDMANAEKVYELTTPSHTENLELIRNFTSRLAQKAGLNEMAAMEIEMAVEEACVNAIKHAHKSDQDKPLRLQIKIDTQKLTALVKDQGRGFDPQKLDRQNAQEVLARPQNGGRGILMMKMLIDEVHFEGGNGKGMQVRLVKHLTSPQKAGCLWKNVAQSS
jgi:serine/threonine-protein kinase RsbW